MGVMSDGSYGVPKGVVFSFPVTCVRFVCVYVFVVVGEVVSFVGGVMLWMGTSAIFFFFFFFFFSLSLCFPVSLPLSSFSFFRSGEWKIVQGLQISDYSRQMMKKSEEELVAEREEALKILGKK